MRGDDHNVDVQRCRTCGYPLEGLTESRCPECGERFELSDPDSYTVEARPGHLYLTGSLVGAVVMLIPVFYAFFMEGGVLAAPSRAMRLLAPLLLAGFAAEVIVLNLSYWALLAPRGAVQQRGAAVAALIVSLVATGGFLVVAVVYAAVQFLSQSE